MQCRAMRRWRHLKFFISDNPDQPLRNVLATGLERLQVMLQDYRDKTTAAGNTTVTSKSAMTNNDALSAWETGMFWADFFSRMYMNQVLMRFPL